VIGFAAAWWVKEVPLRGAPQGDPDGQQASVPVVEAAA